MAAQCVNENFCEVLGQMLFQANLVLFSHSYYSKKLILCIVMEGSVVALEGSLYLKKT